MNFRGAHAVQAFMKKILVGFAALALLAAVGPQADAGQRHRSRGHAISSFNGHSRSGLGYGYRRAHYRHRHVRLYRSSNYDPYYSGYAPYGYGFSGIALSIGGGRHFGGHHHGGHH